MAEEDTDAEAALAIFDLLNRSSEASASSGDTLRFERSMYPFSLSTRTTITGSCLPTCKCTRVALARLIHLAGDRPIARDRIIGYEVLRCSRSACSDVIGNVTAFDSIEQH